MTQNTQMNADFYFFPVQVGEALYFSASLCVCLRRLRSPDTVH